MILSTFTWFMIFYTSLGFYIMLPALAETWELEEHSTTTKILAGILSVLLWPMIFFM